LIARLWESMGSNAVARGYLWYSGGPVSCISLYDQCFLLEARSGGLGYDKFFSRLGLVGHVENPTWCLLSNPRGRGSREPPRGIPGAFFFAINRVFKNQQNAIIGE
jgi:hypothetical protein